MKSCLVLVIGLLAVGVIAMPKRCLETEDCYERQMHPDIPTQPNLKRSVNGEEFNEFWMNQGKSFVLDAIVRQPNKKRAKNVIFFLGDGMSLTTIATSRVYIGGEEQKLSFETFPYTGLSKTYSVDRIVPDSATTSTSYLCGVKANYGTIGVNAKIERDNCQTAKDASNYVYSIAKWSMDAGKSAGFVTTARVTHASPAGVYAHTAERLWENDSEVKETCGEDSGIDDIATQLVHGDVGSRLKVMMGGGKREFLDASFSEKGRRSDGRNLIEEFQNKSPRNAYVETRDELLSFDVKSADRLLGLFQNSHLKYNLEAIDKGLDQPTLEELTKKAIEFIQDDENGYFLFVEGGRIDMAHHDNQAKLALDETEQFSNAIEMARKITNEEDTLIVVTADHSHAFTYSGYGERGRKITGKAGQADDGLPYMTMTYANGPSFETYYDVEKGERIDPTSTSKSKVFAVWPATVPLESETHGGDDVAVYASGPWSHLFSGVFEQNTIPHMLAYASCVGNGLKMC